MIYIVVFEIGLYMLKVKTEPDI